MKTQEILAKAQKEKKDEYRRYVGDFATATMGAFLVFALVALFVVKLITRTPHEETFGLLLGGLGAYLFGRYVMASPKKGQKDPLFSKTTFFLVGSVLALTGCGIMFINFLVELFK